VAQAAAAVGTGLVTDLAAAAFAAAAGRLQSLDTERTRLEPWRQLDAGYEARPAGPGAGGAGRGPDRADRGPPGARLRPDL